MNRLKQLHPGALIGIILGGVLLFGLAGWFLLVHPQSSKLKSLKEQTAEVQANARYMDGVLGQLSGIQVPYVPPDRTHVFHKYRVRLDPRRAGSARRHEPMQHGGSAGLPFACLVDEPCERWILGGDQRSARFRRLLARSLCFPSEAGRGASTRSSSTSIGNCMSRLAFTRPSRR